MNQELIVNLWAYFEANGSLVYALSGKVYSCVGTDIEKISLLQKLAPTDYVTAKKHQLPDRFSCSYTDGSVIPRATFLDAVKEPNIQLFNEIFVNLENELPPLIKFTGLEMQQIKQSLPESPLVIITVLYEDPEGNIRPMISDQDREWANQHYNELHGVWTGVF